MRDARLSQFNFLNRSLDQIGPFCRFIPLQFSHSKRLDAFERFDKKNLSSGCAVEIVIRRSHEEWPEAAIIGRAIFNISTEQSVLS